MCGCNSEAFMGVELDPISVYDIGPGQRPSPEMFGTDSQDTLGVETSFPLTSAPQQNIGE